MLEYGDSEQRSRPIVRARIHCSQHEGKADLIAPGPAKDFLPPALHDLGDTQTVVATHEPACPEPPFYRVPGGLIMTNLLLDDGPLVDTFGKPNGMLGFGVDAVKPVMAVKSKSGWTVGDQVIDKTTCRSICAHPISPVEPDVPRVAYGWVQLVPFCLHAE